MRLYQGSVRQFQEDVTFNRIADRLTHAFENYYGWRPSPSEIGAWQQSSNYLKNATEVAQLTDHQQLVLEHEIPYSTRRIDALLFGTGIVDDDSIVLLELKQWSNDGVGETSSDGNVVVNYKSGRKEVAHPAWQVQGYHFELQDFLSVFQEQSPPKLSSCAFCHNYARLKSPAVLYHARFKPGIDRFPVFAAEDVQILGEYLRERLVRGDGLRVLGRFDSSPIRPSKKLLDHTGTMINERQMFTLIDDQIAAYNAIMHRAKQLVRSRDKSIVIVKGGPGTGKSVIALEVMGELLRSNRSVVHATGSSAFTNTLRKIVGSRAKSLFKFFNSFSDTPENSFDVLVADEAHRIRERSTGRFTPRLKRSNTPQVDELIRSAKLGVYFIDEYQVVRPNEIGSVQLIRDAAHRAGVQAEDIAEFELHTQFRCSGSDLYLQWLDNTLGIRVAEVPKFDHRMKFRIFESPASMMNEVRERNAEKKNCARIVAGFCWKWSDPPPSGALVNDVVVGDLRMPWEKKDQFWKWATDDSGMEQVGTVYTAQGFEFDYIAVIFGNDVVYDPQKCCWTAVPERSRDSQVKRSNPRLKQHLLSVYRVLLSRAHLGVYVYFMDPNTKQYFEEQIRAPRPFSAPRFEE